MAIAPMMKSARHAALVVLLAVPWLFPFVSGPSPSAQAWLITLFVGSIVVGGIGQWQLRADGWAVIVARSWIAAAALSSGGALIQYFGVSAEFSPWLSEAPVGVAYGNLRQRNQYAVLTVIGTAALLTMAGSGARQQWVRLLLILLAAGNAVSSSRTGVIGLILVLGMANVWAWRAGVLHSVGSFSAYVAIAYVLTAIGAPALLSAALGVSAPSVFSRMIADFDCGSRTLLWSNVLELIAQKPWVGWGWGNLDYAHYITLYSADRFCDILDNAHNLPLHIAVELGVPAAILGAVLVIRLGVRLAHCREASAGRQLAWMVLGAILIHSMVEYPLWYAPFFLATVMCIVMLWPRQVEPMTVRTSEAPASTKPWLIGVAGFTMAFVFYAWWDYVRISQLYVPYEQRIAPYRDDALSEASRSWLFRSQVLFAELTTTRLAPGNAAHVARLAEELLHFSPEPRVIEPLIESLVMLQRNDEALGHIARYRLAFPEQYESWRKSNGQEGPAKP